jgi:hypothetical protein
MADTRRRTILYLQEGMRRMRNVHQHKEVGVQFRLVLTMETSSKS